MMHAAFIVAMVVVVTLAAPDYRVMFDDFKTQQGRHYASVDEEATRFSIFVENVKMAQQLMNMNPHAAFGANEFADVSAKEFKIRHSAENFYAERTAMREPVAH